MSNYFTAVISARRPERVPAMKALLGSGAHWFVAKGDGDAYRANGADNVVESGGLCESRNAALDMAFSKDMPCVQMSDDLKAIKKAHSKTQTEPMKFAQAIGDMLHVAKLYRSRLVGVAPTANAFYYNPEKPFKLKAFIVGDMILCIPCDIRFDTNLLLKEDYDFTLKHLKQFGRAVRVDNILAEFAHRTNAGGAVSYRTELLEQTCIAYLKRKWGAVIRDNPRRKNEILLKI
jgi:hypothetical protein